MYEGAWNALTPEEQTYLRDVFQSGVIDFNHYKEQVFSIYEGFFKYMREDIFTINPQSFTNIGSYDEARQGQAASMQEYYDYLMESVPNMTVEAATAAIQRYGFNVENGKVVTNTAFSQLSSLAQGVYGETASQYEALLYNLTYNQSQAALSLFRNNPEFIKGLDARQLLERINSDTAYDNSIYGLTDFSNRKAQQTKSLKDRGSLYNQLMSSLTTGFSKNIFQDFVASGYSTAIITQFQGMLDKLGTITEEE